MKTFEFTDEQRHELIEIFVHGTIQELLSRIEQIVSERITPEQDTIKPYHEHGNSVASDRTEPGESGQSAEDVLFKVWKEWAIDLFGDVREFTFDEFQSDTTWAYFTKAMTTYASHVCADKDREIMTLERLRLEDALLALGELNHLRAELEMVITNQKGKEYDTHMDATIECVGCGHIHSRRYRVDVVVNDIMSESRCPKCEEPRFIISIPYLEEKLSKQGIQYGKTLSELSAANESLTVMVRRNTELEEQNKKYWFMIEHGLGVEDMAPPTYPHP